MNRRAMYRYQDRMLMLASARLYNAARLARNDDAQYHLLLQHVDDLHKCRKISRKQSALGRTLAGNWRGTAEDFLAAIKELA